MDELDPRRESLTAGAEEADRIAPRPDRERSPTALARRRLDARRYLAVGVDHRRRARRQQIAEEPQLGGKVILRRRVIVHVVA